MCEFFAISSSSPTEVSFSLSEFSKHGGLTNLYRHKWVTAYYEQNTACFLYRDLDILLIKFNFQQIVQDKLNRLISIFGVLF